MEYRGRDNPWYHLNLPHAHTCGLSSVNNTFVLSREHPLQPTCHPFGALLAGGIR